MVHQKSIAGYKFIDQQNHHGIYTILRILRFLQYVVDFLISFLFSASMDVTSSIVCWKMFYCCSFPSKIKYAFHSTGKRCKVPNATIKDDWNWIFVFNNFSTRNRLQSQLCVRCAHFDRIVLVIDRAWNYAYCSAPSDRSKFCNHLSFRTDRNGNFCVWARAHRFLFLLLHSNLLLSNSTC